MSSSNECNGTSPSVKINRNRTFQRIWQVSWLRIYGLLSTFPPRERQWFSGQGLTATVAGSAVVQAPELGQPVTFPFALRILLRRCDEDHLQD